MIELPSPGKHLGAARRVGFGLYTSHLLTVWGIAISNVLLGLTLIWSGAYRKRLTLDPTAWRAAGAPRLLAPLGLYVLFHLASLLTSYDLRASLGDKGELFNLSTLPLGLLLVQGEERVRRIVDSLLVLMVLLALFGIGQYLFTDYGPLDNRIPGPFSHYMTFSGVLLLGDCLLLGRLVSNEGWKKPANWAALTLLHATLFLTLTRNAWVAAGLVLTFVLWVRARRFFPVYVGALVVAAALVATLAPDYWARFRSIGDPSNPSNSDRLYMAYAGAHMISERPLFGIGPGLVEQRYPIYRHPDAPRLRVAHLHNSFLNLAAERGLLSLLAYFWLMAAGCALAYRGYQRGGGARGPCADLYLGVLLALLAFNVAGLFEANWRDTEIQRIVLFLLALPVCLALGGADLRDGQWSGPCNSSSSPTSSSSL